MKHAQPAVPFTAIVRPYMQGLFFLLFTVMFFRVSYPLAEDLAANLFFNIDPLVLFGLALSGSAVLSGLILSAATVAFTLVFGRVFCGWLCPMGSVFDASATVFPGTKQKPPFGHGRFASWKYYILVFFAAGALLGLTIVFFLDPIVFLFRVFTLNIHPFIILAENSFLNLFRGPLMGLGFTALAMHSPTQPSFSFAPANLLLFLAAVALIGYQRRFWCRNLCPLGAMLSVLSRFSPRGRRVNDDCTSCGKCARTCPMDAISDDFHTTSPLECILCERCAKVCPVGAISFGFGTAEKERAAHSPSRRGVLVSAVAGIAAAATAGTAVSRQVVAGKRIRPPGAKVEEDFLDSCLRCGECMKSCPTHGLQPAITQAGFEGFCTPVLVPRVGGCEDKCTNCGRVCPTGAIRNLPLKEKQFAIMGNATIDRNYCIAWEQGKLCLVCDEVCPYDAVEFHVLTDEVGTIQRPFVIEDKCTGCGMCEHACPVNGRAAIYVTPINEVRKNTGSYITEKVLRLREVKDEKGVDFFRETASPENGAAPAAAPPDSAAEEELPPGFIR